MGFLEGLQARMWARRDQAERQQAVIGCFVRYFGQAAARPERYVERDWMAEEFTRGCYCAHFAPGVWSWILLVSWKRSVSSRNRAGRTRADDMENRGQGSTVSGMESMSETDTASAKSEPGAGSVSDVKLLAAQLFNETWRLLELQGRGRADDDRMIHAAHASRYHWGQVPSVTPAHLARGEWQISRVYAVLGRAEPALHHARRVLELCQENGIGDWDLAFAYEALARAYAVAGDAGQAREFTDRALAAAEDIADSEERDLVLADLETIPGQPRYW